MEPFITSALTGIENGIKLAGVCMTVFETASKLIKKIKKQKKQKRIKLAKQDMSLSFARKAISHERAA